MNNATESIIKEENRKRDKKNKINIQKVKSFVKQDGLRGMWYWEKFKFCMNHYYKH